MNIAKHNTALVSWLEVFIGLTAITDAFILLFYTSIGLSIQQLGIITMVGAAVVFVTEIPSGMVADVTSRKTTLIISASSMVISSILLLIGSTFGVMVLSAVFLGLAWSFYSGSKQALLYDSYLQEGMKSKFEAGLGKAYAYQLYAMSAITIIGGFLYQFTPRSIFVVSSLASLGMLIVCCLLIEPKRSEKIAMKLADIRQTLSYIGKHEVLVDLILFTSLSYVVNGIYNYHSLYFQQIGFSVELIGFVFAGMFLYGALISHNISRLVRVFGRRALLFMSMPLVGIPYILFGLHPVFFIGFFVFLESTAAGYFSTITNNILNHQARSKDRATVISIEHFIQNVVVATVGAVIAFVAPRVTLPMTYLIIGVFVIIAGTYVFSRLHRKLDWKALSKD